MEMREVPLDQFRTERRDAKVSPRILSKTETCRGLVYHDVRLGHGPWEAS